MCDVQSYVINILQLLPCFVGSHIWEVICHFLRTLKQPFREDMWQWAKASCQPWVRSLDFLPPAMSSGSFWKWIIQPWYSLQMTAALAKFFTVTLREALNQMRSGKSFLDFWCTETMWENKCVLMSSAALFWVTCLHSNRNLTVRFKGSGILQEITSNLGVPRKNLQSTWKQ